MYDRLQKNPEAFKPLFCMPPPPLTSDDLRRLFKPVMSEIGTNTRISEVAAVAFWNDFIVDMEGGLNVYKEVTPVKVV